MSAEIPRGTAFGDKVMKQEEDKTYDALDPLRGRGEEKTAEETDRTGAAAGKGQSGRLSYGIPVPNRDRRIIKEKTCELKKP